MSHLLRLSHDRVLSQPLLRHLSSSTSRNAVLGIRCEDTARVWERRAPLSPSAVQSLVHEGHSILVQPCSKRVFRDAAYASAGAQITMDLSPAQVVIGIKEVPRDLLEGGKSYAFFSHTAKGQSHNLPLLSSMLRSKSRFIDWELLTDEEGKRTTAFGYLAGVAGMADGLSNFGTKALAMGFATPFLELPRPYMNTSMDMLERSLEGVGKRIEEGGMAKELGSVVVVVSGKGRVGEGARMVLDRVGAVWLDSVKSMKTVVEDPNPDLTKIYAYQLELSDYLVDNTDVPFDRQAYREHPGRFRSEFDTRIAPYTTILLNGGFWGTGCPRILTTAQLATIQHTVPSNRFLSVVDVSCDFAGGLEFVTGPTTIDDPIIQFDASTNLTTRDPATPHTTQISSIEILPSELPLDSSLHFSSSILPYVRSLLLDPSSSSTSDLHARALRRATICAEGTLETKHEGLYALLAAKKERKRVVILGSGLVAGPAVRLIASRKDIDLIIASNVLESAEALASPYEGVKAVLLDASDQDSLNLLVRDADVVISLLPAPLHVGVAKLCIENKTSLVTASYVSLAMTDLHNTAKEAGVVLLNELGLDPGIDHASAMGLIEQARASGNKIESFVSFCGGLPSPEASNVPLGYKFSWSPRGVLTAALNPATFRLSSAPHSIPGSSLLANHFPTVPIIPGFNFEGVANRDSISYLAQYGLENDLPTILRGTLRYKGFSRVVDVFTRMGLLEVEEKVTLERWEDLTDICLRARGIAVDGEKERMRAVQSIVGGDVELAAEVIDTLRALHLIPSTYHEPHSILPPIPSSPQAPIDLLSILLASELAYLPHERDTVILHHELVTIDAAGESELFTSTLVQYGVPGQDSAMASTVGMPIAIGALLILDNQISARGIVSPTHPEVWKPLLGKLEGLGVNIVEKRMRGTRGVLKVLERGLVERQE